MTTTKKTTKEQAEELLEKILFERVDDAKTIVEDFNKSNDTKFVLDITESKNILIREGNQKFYEVSML